MAGRGIETVDAILLDDERQTIADRDAGHAIETGAERHAVADDRAVDDGIGAKRLDQCDLETKRLVIALSPDQMLGAQADCHRSLGRLRQRRRER